MAKAMNAVVMMLWQVGNHNLTLDTTSWKIRGYVRLPDVKY